MMTLDDVDLKVTACAIGLMTFLSLFWGGVGYLIWWLCK
jgi:hypothetical protein